MLNQTVSVSYADDNTLYRTTNSINKGIQLLENDSMMFKSLSDNHITANISKDNPLVNKKNDVIIRTRDTEIKNSEYEKLLRVEVGTKLNFNKHLNDIITRLIVINNATLTKLFCDCSLFYCLLLKDISFNAKCLLGWCCLTSNHLFGLENFGDKPPS